MNAVLETIRDLSKPAKATSELPRLDAPRLRSPQSRPTSRSRGSRGDGCRRRAATRLGQRGPLLPSGSPARVPERAARLDGPMLSGPSPARTAADGPRRAGLGLRCDRRGRSLSRTNGCGQGGRRLARLDVQVSQAELAHLLGVSPRQFQRWLSPAETAGPEGPDLRRVRAVARHREPAPRLR